MRSKKKSLYGTASLIKNKISNFLLITRTSKNNQTNIVQKEKK